MVLTIPRRTGGSKEESQDAHAELTKDLGNLEMVINRKVLHGFDNSKTRTGGAEKRSKDAPAELQQKPGQPQHVNTHTGFEWFSQSQDVLAKPKTNPKTYPRNLQIIWKTSKCK